MINVKETANNILNNKQLAFKVLNENKETGALVLATAVNNSFSRALIVVENEQLSFSIQGSNDEQKIVTIGQPIPEIILKALVYLPEVVEDEPEMGQGQEEEETPTPPKVEVKTPKKRVA